MNTLTVHTPSKSAGGTEVPWAIEAIGLSKAYGATKAVNKLTLNVAQGQIIALLGPNGAGKTTLMDLLLGLQKPDTGSSTILGMNVSEAIRRSLVGVVNQTGALPQDYTVGAILKLFSSFYQLPVPVIELIEFAELAHLQKRRIGKLSGGERQRLRLALAMQGDPLVLLLDEPTAGMDIEARESFWKIMGGLREQGKTIFFATHYLNEAENYSQQAIVLRNGSIIAHGPTSELGSGPSLLTARVEASHDTEIIENLRHLDGKITISPTEPGLVTYLGQSTDQVARILLGFPGTHDLRISKPSIEKTLKELLETDSAPIVERENQ